MVCRRASNASHQLVIELHDGVDGIVGGARVTHVRGTRDAQSVVGLLEARLGPETATQAAIVEELAAVLGRTAGCLTGCGFAQEARVKA